MAQEGTGYFLNEEDRAKVQENLIRGNVSKLRKNIPRQGVGAPPIRFGQVQSSWTIGDATVNVLPVSFNDFTVDPDLSLGDAISIYVSYFQYARYVDDDLDSGSIVPYIPFQGEDSNGVKGILAGQLMEEGQNPFGPVYGRDGSDNPGVKINDGDVYYNDGSQAVTGTGTTVYPLNADRWFWVEIVVTPVENSAATVAINSALQTGTSAPDYWDTASGGVTTIKWVTGYIDGTNKVYVPTHANDINLKSLQTFGIDTNYQDAATINKGKFGMVKDATGSLAGKSYFLELAASVLEHELGEFIGYSKGTEYQFGGTDVDSNIEFVENIETDTADQLTVEYYNQAFDIDAGLVQDFSAGVAKANLILEALKWIGIEVGGQFVHRNSPVDSESHPDHWFKVQINITGGIVIDGGTVVDTITLYFDRTGHLWKYDNETQPGEETNYRYRHCSDSATNPDLILSAQAANTVIQVLGKCYYEVGTTDAEATDPAPTVETTFATCELCEAAPDVEQWKWCNDDLDAFKLATDFSTLDYIWVCSNGGTYGKVYNDGATTGVAETPLKIEPTNVPTSCITMDPPAMSGSKSGDYDADSESAGAKTSWSTPTLSGGGTVVANVYDISSRNTMRFDGSSDYFQAASATTLNFTGAFTFYIVCKSDTDHNGYIVHKGENEISNDNQYMFSKQAAGGFLFRLGVGTTNYQVLSTGDNLLNLWVCQFNGSNRMYLRRNGAAVNDTGVSGSLNTGQKVNIGAHSGSSGLAGYFDGDICEIAMYSAYHTGTTLTDNEQNIMLKWNLGPPCSNP